MSPPRAGRRAAVLGSPVAHSLSPVLHRAAYAQLGLDWTYDAVEAGEGGLAAFVASLDPTWAGLSLTMPLKREALELARVRSETATLTRAANTLVPLGSGWQAENTDVPGMVAALAATGLALPSRAVVLGGGATAASTLVALGRSGVRAVGVAVRRPEAGDVLRSLAERVAVVLDVRPWDDVPVLLDGAGLVVDRPHGRHRPLGPGGPGGARAAVRRRLRPLAHAAGSRLGGARGTRARRARPPGPPGGAAGRADDRCGTRRRGDARRGSGRARRPLTPLLSSLPPDRPMGD